MELHGQNHLIHLERNLTGFFFRGFLGDGPPISKFLGVFLKMWWRNPEDKDKGTEVSFGDTFPKIDMETPNVEI